MSYAEWIRIKAETLRLREEFDDPRLREIAFEFKQYGTFLFLEPKCVVTKPPYKLVGLQLENRGNIQIEESDYYVRSVPRDTPREAFDTRCWLDAKVVSGNLTGISCRVVYVDDTKGLSYNLILKREIEQRRFN